MIRDRNQMFDSDLRALGDVAWMVHLGMMGDDVLERIAPVAEQVPHAAYAQGVLAEIERRKALDA